MFKVMQNVLAANSKKAEEIRALLKEKNIFMLNLISAPGSGKTTLLEKTLPLIKDRYNVAIIEGDVETSRDAERLAKFGIPISLITTSGACHLESVSIEKALTAFNLDNLDLIIIENVGNLVCPAEFDIGENAKVAVLSVPEGDDKLLKYPLLFREAQLLILNKIDFLTEDFKKELFYNDLQQLNPVLPVIELSCKTSLGMEKWLAWLDQKISKFYV